MADLKNIKIGNDTYKGVKKISVQDADVSGIRDSFLSESFIENNTVQTINENVSKVLYPSNGYDATKQITVTVNVPGTVPSGTLTITDNGIKDVKSYANVDVKVEPNLEQKTVTITENGTIEVTPTSGKDGISKVAINTSVPSSGGVEEVTTSAAMDTLLVEANVGKYYKYTGSTTTKYVNGNLYLVEVTETDITSTVSAFNISLKLNEQNSANLQSTLGGGNGTYVATINDANVATPTIDGNTLNLYSDTTSSASTNVIVTSGSKSLTIPVNVKYETCFTADTLITMFDGTTKRIDQIELGDIVLSLDRDGNRVPGYVYYSDSHCGHMGKHYDRFVFEDGTELKIVHRHRFYNVNEKKFVHLDLWYEGDEAYKLNDTTTALKEVYIRDYEGDIPHYTLFCEHNTYFANGLLCGNRFSDPVDLNHGIEAFSVERKQYYPIILTLPEVFSDCKDAWLDSNTKDLMLKKTDGTTINYYQIGYDDSYATAYKKPSADSKVDLETIESSYEKVAEISHEEGTNCVEGKEFDIIVIYVKRTSRDSDTAVQAANEIGGVWAISSLPSIIRLDGNK